MSHELSIRKDGSAELLLADKGAWHQLGEIVQGVFNSQEAIQKVIPWEALSLNLFAHAPKHSPHAYLADLWSSGFCRVNSKGIFRSDTGNCLGIVGNGYAVVQPQHMFNHVDSLIEGTGYHYESVGALKGGSVLFITARVGELDILSSGDKIRTYLAFLNSFDGSLAAQVYLTGTRIVCMNTLQYSLSDKRSGSVKYKHTRGVHEKLNQAQSLMAGVLATEQDLQTKLETLAKRKIQTRQSYESILDKLFPGDSGKTKSIKSQVTALYADNDHNAFPDWAGTPYALYNAVTNYVDHDRATRGEDKERSRYESAVLGSGAVLKQKALNTILAMTEDSTSTSVAVLDLPCRDSIPDSVDSFLDTLGTVDDDDNDDLAY